MDEIIPDMDWNEDTTYAIGGYRRFCSYFGIWPSKDRFSSGLKVTFYMVLQTLTVGIFLQRLVVYGNCGTTQEIVDTFTVSMSSTQIGLKCIFIYMQHDRFKNILDATVEDWALTTDKESKSIMLKFARIGRNIFYCQCFLGLFTAVPLILGEIPHQRELVSELDNSTTLIRNIILAPNCWVLQSSSTSTYYLFWSLLALYVFCVAMATVACNLIVYGFGLHVYVQFELLYRSVQELDVDKTFKEQRRIVKKFIKRHNRMLDMANELEDASTAVIFSEVSAIVIVGCIAGTLFLLAMQSGDRAVLTAMAGRIFLVFIQLFIFCYMGEKLSIQADKIQNAIYNNCPWYEFPPQIGRDLKLIMIRSNYPFFLTAGKFYIMNLLNFKEVVKSMFSFFSVLRLMLQN
ncbi:odorant receptor 82a-like [Eupeodes corollae]|uniref:Odorant receptor n=1 Tax=Scaeva pyrastri TaxID=219539 RepID=A0A1B3B7B3_SCAPY|nr:odorant receptor 82a-like [Eupeodes corollae]AOE48090.1 putative odorant receptor OR24 [Scaeva pyrastri]